jgi:hypothetical protein
MRLIKTAGRASDRAVIELSCFWGNTTNDKHLFPIDFRCLMLKKFLFFVAKPLQDRYLLQANAPAT